MSDFSVKWDEIAHLGRGAGRFRVCPDHHLDLFIGYTSAGEREFTLESSVAALDEAVLPEFENISVTQQESSGVRSLTLCLTDHQLKDLFSIICCDLAEASSRAETPAGAAGVFGVRLGRWADLLRRGLSRQMSFKERLGLMGELCMVLWVIDNCEVEPVVAVRGWRGPDGDTNDIGLNHVRIEVKSQLSTQAGLIRISSLDQLDSDGRELSIALHRFVAAGSGISLKSLVDEIVFRLAGNYAGLMEFQRKLLLLGYQQGAAYVDETFNLDSTRFYRVGEGFPRLVPSAVPEGVVRAQYDIACDVIDEYRIEQMELEALVHG